MELDRLQNKKPSTFFSLGEYLEILYARAEIRRIHGNQLLESSMQQYEAELDVLAKEKEEMLSQRKCALSMP